MTQYILEAFVEFPFVFIPTLFISSCHSALAHEHLLVCVLVTWTGNLATAIWCSTGVKNTMKWATLWIWWASRSRWSFSTYKIQTPPPPPPLFRLLSAYKCSHVGLSGKGGHDDYPGWDPVSGKYHIRADWEWCPESERDFTGLAQSHGGELAQVYHGRKGVISTEKYVLL